METYIAAIKDILVVVAPIIVAYISYRSNKKTAHDIQLELEKNLKEKDADTNQMLTKINAELESQKQIISWQNSLPMVDGYVNQMDQIRYGMILSRLVDTFFSKISLTMPPAPKSHNTAYVLPWEEPLHWQSRSSGYSSS